MYQGPNKRFKVFRMEGSDIAHQGGSSLEIYNFLKQQNVSYIGDMYVEDSKNPGEQVDAQTILDQFDPNNPPADFLDF